MAELSKNAEVPRAVWSGTFTVNGMIVRCSVLDNGQRVIDAEDLDRLMAAFNDPAVHLDLAGVAALTAWAKQRE